jgi:glycosyltransferase involved in cell wall biosynthesis
MRKILIAMPVYNESGIIRDVVQDLMIETSLGSVELVLVDDKSTDATFEILQELNAQYSEKVHVFQNEINLGHGGTLCKALSIVLQQTPDLIVSCDGDGPISGKDLIRILELEQHFDVLEVARKRRVEPLFRKFTTQFTRLIVLIKSGKLPIDANTPIRVYQPNVLAKLLPKVVGSQVPNLLLSIICRQKKLVVLSQKVNVVERKINQTGTMWGQGRAPRNLPNKRFMKFAVKSFWEVVRFNEK